MSEARERIARVLYADEPHTTIRGLVSSFEDAPPHYRDQAYQQAEAVLSAIGPAPSDVAELAALLAELLYDRGRDVRTWPEDEAAAYRELGWEPGHLAARTVMFEKAAHELLVRKAVSA